ncbi:MAG TPA: VOC family protein [Streptosporangiaceae bacterium]|nr:VOC family protein [Streptosporangiaceae bacterium]
MKTTSSVSVSVDPAVAFTAFTEEIDLWWVRGPINYFDSGRAVGMRCEPGVGGRLLEVYDEATGEGLELARITAWEPGRRLAWDSSVDDVRTEVLFRPSGQGTEVTVVATIPDGGADRGGTAWVRVVPKWFPAWCQRRATAPRPQRELSRLAAGLYYARPAAAARFLSEVFGLASPDPLPEGPDPLPEGSYGPPWIEFRVGDASLMVFTRAGEPPAGAQDTHETWVFVDDLDAHFQRVQAAGATILSEIRQTGFRAYTAADPEGHRWVFAQARPNQR